MEHRGDFNVETFLELTPEAGKGGGPTEAYANECICLFSRDDTDLLSLHMTLVLFGDITRAISAVLPLDYDGGFGCDDAHTMMVLVPSGRRGILKLEQGLNDPDGSANDCIYVRFYAFKSVDVPYSGPSKLIQDVCDSIKGVWPNTKVISDLERDTYSRRARVRQEAQWRSQGLCSHCGGQMGRRKCKSCGRT